jgi:HKD family nuclease
MEELGKATEAQIAVAFFNPNDKMLEALKRLTKLELIISEEFTVNNPYKLEKLKTATLRSIPTDAENGKLHAKILILKRQDGSYWILLGSANLTHQGMFSNQEAGMVMESGNPADETSILEIRNWFDSLRKNDKALNLAQAKSIFDTRSQYRLVPRPSREVATDAGYWALKTTSGSVGKSHWQMFLEEKVIAIGWEDLPDPSEMSDAQRRAAISKTYPSDTDQEVNMIASSIKQFVDLGTDAIVLLCRGYNATQKKDVHIHGIARVTGPFRADSRRHGDWRFKHDAVIQEINVDILRNIVAASLRKQTLMKTIHKLEKADFDEFARKLKEFGVHVEV